MALSWGAMTEPVHRAHRFEASLPAVLLHEGNELPCEADNFSRSGLLLAGRSDWPDNDTFKIVLRSASGDLQIPLVVRVVRRIPPSETTGLRLAVEFVGIDEETRERLEFLLRRVIEGRGKAPNLPEIPQGARPHEIRKLLDTVPLSVRVSLAGHGGPKEREPLLHDQQPAVLEALARNPSLLVLEARTLAGSIHSSSSVLTALVTDGRFAGDEELRVMVLAHSKVPPANVEKIAAALSLVALRRALTKSSLTSAARAAIQKRIMAGERRP